MYYLSMYLLSHDSLINQGFVMDVMKQDQNINVLPQAYEIYQKLFQAINVVIKDQSGAIRYLLAAFASGGHVLLEDYPGTGKTTLAKALAKGVQAHFQRIQFTPDLLPSDIIGASIFDPKNNAFNFHRGPIFSQILLADEINRASPRTQSALLEAMAENQVSVEGQQFTLDKLFFVVATQNPVEFHGTYPLPEAQMDRFALRFSLGYVSAEEELDILNDQNSHHPLDNMQSVINLDEAYLLRSAVSEVLISDELKQYIVQIVRATRTAEGIKMGASPRASLNLMKSAQALALFDGLDYVQPEHIQSLAVNCIAHRIVIDPQTRFSGQSEEGLLARILEDVPVPV